MFEALAHATDEDALLFRPMDPQRSTLNPINKVPSPTRNPNPKP